MDHYLKHLFEYNFPMPYGDDFTKAPLFKQLGIAPGNADEYDENVKGAGADSIGYRLMPKLDLEGWQKKLDDFLASRKE